MHRSRNEVNACDCIVRDYVVRMTQDASGLTLGPDPLEDFLCFSLYGAGLAMNRLYKPLLDPFGITYPQYLALIALRTQEGRTVGELGERLFLESNTLTPLIKRLEAAGLVTRTRDKADERVVRVHLTDAGRTVTDQALACVPGQVFEASGLTGGLVADMNKVLAALRDALLKRGRAF